MLCLLCMSTCQGCTCEIRTMLSTNIHEKISCVVGRKDTRTAALLLCSSVSPLTVCTVCTFWVDKATRCLAPAAIRCEKPSRRFLVEPECHREPAGQWVRLSLAAREAQPCITRLLRNSRAQIVSWHKPNTEKWSWKFLGGKPKRLNYSLR